MSKKLRWVSQLLIALIVIQISFFSRHCLAIQMNEGIQIYHSTPLSIATKTEIARNITRYHHAENIWDILREEFSLPHYEDNYLVQEKITWFMNNQDYLLRAATRATPYLYYILQQVKKRHLPAEIVLLPIIESGYNPFSISSMGAAGIWQLMPDTATNLGVKQNASYDGRRDIVASTNAALNYLAYLQNFFEGRWLLAIAAYNTGEGNVLAAIKRNIRDGRNTDFWSLPVAQQTRDYVPSLLALATIISHPQRYPIYFPAARNAPYLAQIDIRESIDLQQVARFAGLSYRQLIQLNPALTSSANGISKPFKLILPIENIAKFTENFKQLPIKVPTKLQDYPKRAKAFSILARKSNASTVSKSYRSSFIKKNIGPKIAATTKSRTFVKHKIIKPMLPVQYRLLAGDTIYMIRPGDNLPRISKRFKVNQQLLIYVNHLQGKQLISGKQIIIPTHLQIARNQKQSINRISKKLYVVQRGDTLEKIAKKFKSSPNAIRLVNLMDDNFLRIGEKIVVPTHLHG